MRDFHAGSKAGSQGSMNDVIEGSSIMTMMTEMTTEVQTCMHIYSYSCTVLARIWAALIC